MTEEIFSILNEDGSHADYTSPRSIVHQQGLWHRSVHIWVVDEWERILLQQRSFTKDSHPGLWDISCAGHISAGQTSIEAAIRELQEELNLEVNESQLQLLFVEKEEATLHDGAFIDREFHDVYWLSISAAQAKQIRPDPKELASIRWISPEAFYLEQQENPDCFVDHQNEYIQILARFGVPEQGAPKSSPV